MWPSYKGISCPRCRAYDFKTRCMKYSWCLIPVCQILCTCFLLLCKQELSHLHHPDWFEFDDFTQVLLNALFSGCPWPGSKRLAVFRGNWHRRQQLWLRLPLRYGHVNDKISCNPKVSGDSRVIKQDYQIQMLKFDTAKQNNHVTLSSVNRRKTW